MAILMSGTWMLHVISHYNQTSGDMLFSKVNSSLRECAILCLVQMSCYMFEFFMLTKVCDVFTGIAPSNTSIIGFGEPRVVHKEITNCQRSGYTFDRAGNICVKLMQGKMSWKDARSTCEKDNGRLLVLRTTKQTDAIRTYLASITKKGIFIGLTDAMNEGQWQWIGGTPFDRRQTFLNKTLNNYDQCYPKEQNNADCAMFKSNSVFDVHCDSSHHFICERPQLI